MKNSQRVVLEPIKNPDRFVFSEKFLPEAVRYASGKVFDIMGDFVHLYPTPCSENLMYGKQKNEYDWTDGFWTGMLWLSYELTGNALFRAVAEAQYDDYKQRLDNFTGLDHHDIGFLYIPSLVAQYKLTGAKKAKKAALWAAELLSRRYSPGAGIIQVRDRDPQGKFIIDCCMNIPLLFWASKETGDRKYYLQAFHHISQVCNYMIRDDGSTYQNFQVDELTGEPMGGSAGQGYSLDSCWSRGHSWVIYGLAIAYRYTMEKELLEMAKREANYCLNRLPSDFICNWDFIFTGDDDDRDASAAPVIACGLLELARQLGDDDPDAKSYYQAGGAILESLSKSYLTKGLVSNGILQHGIYTSTKRKGQEGIGCGVNECCIWGDYFYLEGLVRLTKEWKMYW